MTQHSMLNVKLPSSQLNKLKSRIKNRTEVTLNLSSNLIGNSNDKTNFLHKFLITNTQVSKIRKGFANGSSTDLKFSKAQLSKMQSGVGFLPEIETGITGIDNFINFPLKMSRLYLKELSNMGTKKI